MLENESLNHNLIEDIESAMSLDEVDNQPNHGVSHERQLHFFDDERVYILHGINGSTEIIINAGSGRGMIVFELATERGQLYFIPDANLGLKPLPNGKWCNSAWLEDPSKRIKMGN